MLIKMLKSKIHRATVTQTDLEYEGSLTLDRDLIEAGGFLPHEKVHVFNIDNGARLETYIIEGKPGSGEVCLNGAAARLGHRGDKVIIVSFCLLTPEEAEGHKPTIVTVDNSNKVK
ncbi:MAG: aspartate 1-decarboxylase [candidate division Zixibacteria bacterium]|nr:aspartate 1-decarboxylase [candidate division Zixibacteria bacterium]